MTQLRHIAKNNTKIIQEGLQTRVRLWSTDVVTLCPEQIILNTGNWFTQTTKVRMNQASHQFDLGYYVYQKAGQWYVNYQNQVHLFQGNQCVLWRPTNGH